MWGTQARRSSPLRHGILGGVGVGCAFGQAMFITQVTVFSKEYPMQVTESEIIIHLKYKLYLKKMLILSSVCILFSIGFFVHWLVMGFQLAADASQFPDIQKSFYQEMIFNGGGYALFILLFYGALLTCLIRELRSHSPYICINHEGIFTSHNSFLTRWAEIKELSSASFRGVPYLSIVPWNLAEVASRARASSRPFTRFGISITRMLFRRSKFGFPIGIYQRALPISIDELLATIREHFATELREHHILI